MAVGWDRSDGGVSECMLVVGAFLFSCRKRGTDRRLRKYVVDVDIV